MRNPILLLMACAWAACIPLLDRIERGSQNTGGQVKAQTIAWPTHWEGRPLRPLPLNAEETRFAGAFPGDMARFTDGSAEILFRRVDRPTRKLHPSADCLRATGYAVKPRPAVSTPDGRTWSCHLATRKGETLLVREVVVAGMGETGTGNFGGGNFGAGNSSSGIRGAGNAEAGASWTDISSWYWNTLWGDVEGPWTAVTLSRRVSQAAP